MRGAHSAIFFTVNLSLKRYCSSLQITDAEIEAMLSLTVSG